MRPFVSRTALAAACCLITGTVAHAPLASAAAGENLPVGRELAITNRYALPILELSGLATARTAPTKSGATGTRDISLYAVGDKTYDVVTFYIAGSSGGIAISAKDASPALGKRASTESQWEAVAIDELAVEQLQAGQQLVRKLLVSHAPALVAIINGIVATATTVSKTM